MSMVSAARSPTHTCCPRARPGRSTTVCSCSPSSWYPYHGVRLPMVTIIFFFDSPHLSLTAVSINSLQLLLCFVVFRSPPTLSRSLITQSFHRILGLPHLHFPSTFWASYLCQFFISRSFPMTTQFNILITSFFLKVSLSPTSLSICLLLTIIIHSLHSHDSSYPVIFANLHLLLFSC